MYFKFFKPQDWRKRFVVHRRGLIQSFPSMKRSRRSGAQKSIGLKARCFFVFSHGSQKHGRVSMIRNGSFCACTQGRPARRFPPQRQQVVLPPFLSVPDFQAPQGAFIRADAYQCPGAAPAHLRALLLAGRRSEHASRPIRRTGPYTKAQVRHQFEQLFYNISTTLSSMIYESLTSSLRCDTIL